MCDDDGGFLIFRMKLNSMMNVCTSRQRQTQRQSTDEHVLSTMYSWENHTKLVCWKIHHLLHFLTAQPLVVATSTQECERLPQEVDVSVANQRAATT
jgi:hypothetical protein